MPGSSLLGFFVSTEWPGKSLMLCHRDVKLCSTNMLN